MKKTLLIFFTLFQLLVEVNAQNDCKLIYSVETGITTAKGELHLYG